MTTSTLWRAFPWDSTRRAGELYSPSHVPRPRGRGRFDLPIERSSVLYLAESGDHAVGEALQAWRGQRLLGGHLKRAGLPLSLVTVELDEGIRRTLADLCDPEVLTELGIPPDRLASRHRWTTQPLASSIWDRGHVGLRWWSSFWGDWHTVVLFTSRSLDGVRFGEPEPLRLDSPAVLEAARLLGIEVETS